MPLLKKRKGESNLKRLIRTELPYHKNNPKQAIAIAYSMNKSRKKKRKGWSFQDHKRALKQGLEGPFYRLHWYGPTPPKHPEMAGREFSAENASSREMKDDEDVHESKRKPLRGYSVVTHPHKLTSLGAAEHLDPEALDFVSSRHQIQSVEEKRKDKVTSPAIPLVRFYGKRQKETGNDGEPLVVPHPGTESWTTLDLAQKWAPSRNSGALRRKKIEKYRNSTKNGTPTIPHSPKDIESFPSIDKDVVQKRANKLIPRIRKYVDVGSKYPSTTHAYNPLPQDPTYRGDGWQKELKKQIAKRIAHNAHRVGGKTEAERNRILRDKGGLNQFQIECNAGRQQKEETTGLKHVIKSDSSPKEIIKYKDLTLCIENPVGSKRAWIDSHEGTSGVATFHFPYGYIKGTQGRDGDSLDCFVGPDLSTDKVYVIKQVKPSNGNIDEYKCMLAFESLRQAKNAYLLHYSNNKYFGDIKEYDYDDFKKQFVDNIKKAIEHEDDVQDSMDFNDLQTVEYMLNMLPSFSYEQHVQMASEIWGATNVTHEDEWKLQAEIEGFLLDQQEMLETGEKNQEKPPPLKTSNLSPDQLQSVNNLRLQLGLRPAQ